MKKFIEHIGIDSLPDNSITIGDDLALFTLKSGFVQQMIDEARLIAGAEAVVDVDDRNARGT